MNIRQIFGARKRAFTYDQDGLATTHNTEFMSDPRFARAYEAGHATGSWGKKHIQWRMHVVTWAAELALRIKGDFVECGTHKGGSAMAIATYLDWPKQERQFYLFDTFTGIDKTLASKAELERGSFKKKYTGDVFEEVQQRFGRFENIHVVRGSVPASLEKVRIDKVAFLHIDMNNAAPEIAAAEHFWPKLVPGAPVILDDYNWTACVEQKTAFDRFAADKGISILSLPTGQGMLIKP